MPLYKVTPNQYAGFLSYFNRCSRDGKIGLNCLRAALDNAGIKATTTEVQEMIDSISVDSTGIDWQCFIDYVSHYTAFRNNEQEYAEAFRLFDRSGCGELSRADIAYVLEKLGIKTDMDKLFDEIDENKDGVIEFNEFLTLMKKRF